MPKQKITKEMVVEAAFTLVRAGGMEQVQVKAIAEKLGCSVQPIYSYCKSMEGLRRDVTERAGGFIREYMAAHIDRTDIFRSTGEAYLRLAREEPYIFQLFILRRREGISSLEELYRSETDPQIAEFIARELKISIPSARRLHLHMLIYNVGVGAILATAVPGIPAEEISARLEEACQIFLSQVQEQEKTQ